MSELGVGVKIALNFHAYGNLFIHPFNFDATKNNPELKKYVHQYEAYMDIIENGGLPDGN
jgi:hypothetical protein